MKFLQLLILGVTNALPRRVGGKVQRHCLASAACREGGHPCYMCHYSRPLHQALAPWSSQNSLLFGSYKSGNKQTNKQTTSVVSTISSICLGQFQTPSPRSAVRPTCLRLLVPSMEPRVSDGSEWCFLHFCLCLSPEHCSALVYGGAENCT